MNDTNPLTEAKASLALSDLNRRERLLKIIRGKPEWKYGLLVCIWLVLVIYVFRTEAHNSMVLFILTQISRIRFTSQW